MVTVQRSDPDARSREAPGPSREQSRARYPVDTGFIERDGWRTFYEVYGKGEPAILFAASWTIVHSRIWKSQIPYFARHQRVVTFDPRGNGRSDRPSIAEAYTEHELAADLLAVMDATRVEQAVLVSLSLGAVRALVAAAAHPERVAGLVFVGPAVPLGEAVPGRDIPFDKRLATSDGWARYNRHFWRRDYRAFLEFFFAQCFTEPHSTKPIEDAIGWGLETDPETLILTEEAPALDEEAVRGLCALVQCPTLVIQGDADAVTGPSRGIALAQAIPNASIAMVARAGHIPSVRDPIMVNLLLRDFVRSLSKGHAG